MIHDIRMALRSLRRRPAFAAIALLTFTIGAAVNAIMLAFVQGILLEPLPLREPHRLVAVWPGRFWSNEQLIYLRARTPMFSDVGGLAPGWTMSMTGAGEPAKMTIARVSPDLFRAIGAQPALGRAFSEAEGGAGRGSVAVLSHATWVRHFGADARVVGRAVRLDGQPFEIVGVMPPAFELFGRTSDLWIPFAIDPASWSHKLSFSLLVARLAPGVPLERADRDFRALIPQMRRDFGYPDAFGQGARLEDLRASQVGDVRASLLVLAGACGLILLIGASNVGTLLLTRTAGRAREIAVRAALGASRVRIAREILAESLTVGLIGALAGVLVARAALPAALALVPADTPRTGAIRIDLAVSALVVAISVALALLFGGAAAATSTRIRVAPALRSGASSDSRAGRRIRAGLVAAEIALAVVLSIGAGLMLQTLWRLNRVDTGFRPDGVLTLRLQPAFRAPQFSTAGYYDRILERLRGVPGIAHAGAIQHLPFSGYSWNGALDVEGYAVPQGGARPTAGLRIVTDGYFDAIGQAILAGRAIDRSDIERDVAVVNDLYARRYHGSAAQAIGRRLRINGGGVQGKWQTIVGVVADVHHTSLADPAMPEIYTAVTKTSIAAMMVALRTAGDPVALAPAVREAIRSVDPDVPIADIQTMEAMIGRTLARSRLLMALLVALAAGGLALGVVGVYGVVAYSIARRRRELGIRMALGAERRTVVFLVLREGLWYAVVGLAFGLPASFLATRALAAVLFGVHAAHPPTYAAAAALLTMVVLAASYLPARRAANVAPMEAIARSPEL